MVIIVKLNKTMVKIYMTRRKTDFTNIKCCGCQKGNLTSKTALRERINGKPTGRWSCHHCYHLFSTYGQHEKPKKRYNETNMCPNILKNGEICGRSLIQGNTCMERDLSGNQTGNYVCQRCYNNIYSAKLPDSHNNIMKLLRNIRTGNQDPNSNQAKGDNSQELACMLYGWEDLNKKFDNYRYPIDCYDPKTELYYQIKSALYDSSRRSWHEYWENVHNTDFVSLIFFCKSKDGQIIERIYKFPKKEVIFSKTVEIFKNPSPSRGSWVEKFRVKDSDELKKVNDIWKEILAEKKMQNYR